MLLLLCCLPLLHGLLLHGLLLVALLFDRRLQLRLLLARRML